MSRNTEIIIGATHVAQNPDEAIRRLFELSGTLEASIVLRSIGESHEFDELAASIQSGTGEVQEQWVLLGYDLTVDSVVALYRDGTCLSIDVGGCPLAETIDVAVRAKIARKQLGDLGVNGVFLKIGNHDIFTLTDADEPLLLGAFLFRSRFGGMGRQGIPTLFVAESLSWSSFVISCLVLSRISVQPRFLS